MWNRQQAMENHQYWSDPRVINSLKKKHSCFVEGSHTLIDMNWVEQTWYDNYEAFSDNSSESAESIGKKYEAFLKEMNVNDTSIPVRVVTRYQECYQCGGRGKTVNPSIDFGGLSRIGEDEDFEEAYWNGRYDITCSACKGSGEEQILEYDTENKLYNWCCNRLARLEEHEHSYALEIAAERRFGC